MRRLLYFSILLSLSFLIHACNNKNDSERILSEYKKNSNSLNKIKFHPDSIVYKKGFKSNFTYNSNDELVKIQGSIFGKNYGHFFRFTRSGKLISYQYLISENKYWYKIQYDPETKVYSEDGTPFEDYFIKTFRKTDSAIKYTLHFVSFPRDSLNAFIYVNNKFLELSLTKSDFMPFLYETDVKVNRKNGMLLIKTIASNLKFDLPGLPSSKTFIDSIPVYSNYY